MGMVAFVKHPPLHEPSRAQKHAGNYAKRKIKWRGMTISIENEQGSFRRGTNRDGKSWEQRMSAPYGEILGTEGTDGDAVDVFVGPNLEAPTVYVVHARKVNRWDEYDEDKCMVGWPDAESAKQAFLDNYSDPRFFGDMVEMPVDEFLTKVKATKEKPAMIKAEQLSLFSAPVQVAGSVKKDGTVVKTHMRVQKVSSEHQQGPREKIQAIVDRHGGREAVGKLIGAGDQTKVNAVVSMLAHAAHLNEGEVREFLGLETKAAIGDTKMAESETKGAENETPESIRAEGKKQGLEHADFARRGLDFAEGMTYPPYQAEWARSAWKAGYDEGVSREGETKAEDGVEYTLKNGHWHRSQPLPDPLRDIAEDKEDLATEMHNAPHGEKANELIGRIAEKHRAIAEPEPVAADTEPDEMDPNSANYRYRDTGYVAGSRKEMAADLINTARMTGNRLLATDIDWSALEENPREAKKFIVKSNLFGVVDWDALRAGGMDPGAGFLIDRVYASVAQEPEEDRPEARRDFALGLETLRTRLEACRSPDQVTDILKTIRDEIEGVMLSARESEEYQAALALYRPLIEKVHEVKNQRDAAYNKYNSAKALLSGLTWDREKRTRRKWKPDPELETKFAEATATFEKEDSEYTAFLSSDPKAKSERRDVGNGYTAYDNDYEWEARQAREVANSILSASKMRNLAENTMTRAWGRLGMRFMTLINYRRYKGSDTFAGHVTTAKTGKIKDWSWAEKEGAKREQTSTKREINFQLKVAENFERKGGRSVSAASTEALKGMFQLRDVQSGNWVLRDVNSATFHVQRACEALADLSDLTATSDAHVAMNGRLAIAFGARGHGNQGFQGAARAHYEPVHRVINLTKMGGGGALGHEWFHAMDNLVKEAEGAGAAGVEEYLTEDPDLLPPGELRDAFRGVRDAINTGEHRLPEKIEYSAKDFRTAHYNIDHPHNPVAKLINEATDLPAAVIAVDDYYDQRHAPDTRSKKTTNQYKTWRRLAVAYHHNKADGDKVMVKTGAPMSSYAYEAAMLDAGSPGKYWSKGRELAARAFQSWTEDKLASLERRNDYLSVFADNKYYNDPIFGQQNPFPDGEERQRINAAFDKLFAVMKSRNTLAKAMEMLAASNG